MNQHGKQINHVSTQFTSLGQLNTLFPEHDDHAITALRIEYRSNTKYVTRVDIKNASYTSIVQLYRHPGDRTNVITCTTGRVEI